jgi:hypothetical protein
VLFGRRVVPKEIYKSEKTAMRASRAEAERRFP